MHKAAAPPAVQGCPLELRKKRPATCARPPACGLPAGPAPCGGLSGSLPCCSPCTGWPCPGPCGERRPHVSTPCSQQTETAINSRSCSPQGHSKMGEKEPPGQPSAPRLVLPFQHLTLGTWRDSGGRGKPSLTPRRSLPALPPLQPWDTGASPSPARPFGTAQMSLQHHRPVLKSRWPSAQGTCPGPRDPGRGGGRGRGGAMPWAGGQAVLARGPCRLGLTA